MTTQTARATAVGAAWNYGAQIATVVAQLGYAAVTSRLLPARDFGAYGVALTVAGLVTMVVTAGLPQSIARLQTLDRRRIGALLQYALALGVVAAVLVLLSAPFWAGLWGVPGAAPVLRTLAAGAFAAPLLGLGTGLLVRQGRFRALATATFAGNVGGMAVGVAGVLLLRTAPALVVSPVVAQLAIAAACLLLSRHLIGRGRPTRDLLRDVRYSAGVTLSSVLAYLAGNVGKFAMSTTFGAVLLGHWNRADVLTTTPFYQVQNALAQALYPAFRQDDDAPDAAHRARTARVWADLLGLVAWLCLPAAAVLAVLTPVVIPFLFGGGWSAVGAFTPALAVIGAVQVLAFVLVGALEVLARFRWIWGGHVVAIVVNSAGALVAVAVHAVLPALVGVIVGLSAMHAVQAVLCTRAGLLAGRRLARHYAAAAAFAAVLAALLWVALHLPALAAGGVWVIPVVVLGAVVVAAVAWRYHHRLPPLRLAGDHGLLPAPVARYVAARELSFARGSDG